MLTQTLPLTPKSPTQEPKQLPGHIARRAQLPPFDSSAVCERLKQVRIKVAGPRGQSAFASFLGLAASSYNYYEKSRLPPIDMIDLVSKLTGVPLEWLIRGEPADFDLDTFKTLKMEPEISVRQFSTSLYS